MSIHGTQPLAVDAFRDELPVHTACPTDNARAFIDHLPFPTVPSESFDGTSPSVVPLSVDGTADGFIVDGIPTELLEHDGYRSRMRTIQCRLYLLRCEVLQSTVNAVEQKPWAQCSDVSAHRHYRNILDCATKAQQLAEAISNHDLQARSKYWSGRACGGLCDWEAAISHFAAAVKLHIPNGNPKNRPHQRRGVLQFNKDDAEFLLQSVTRHYDAEAGKKKEAGQAVRGKQVNQSSNLVEDIESGVLKEHHWMPYYECMIHQAKQKSAIEKQLSRLLSQLLAGKHGPTLSTEEMAALENRLSLNDGKRELRKIFNAEEWLYILHGDKATEKRNNNIERNSVNNHNILSENGKSHDSVPSQTPSPASSINTSQHASPEISYNLGTEMDHAGYKSGGATPSLFGSITSHSSREENETPSPPAADLQGRRNVKLPPISTSATQKDVRPGEAVQISFTSMDL